jgi:hypothetical protein
LCSDTSTPFGCAAGVVLAPLEAVVFAPPLLDEELLELLLFPHAPTAVAKPATAIAAATPRWLIFHSRLRKPMSARGTAGGVDRFDRASGYSP